jgi:hypothetical protein
MRLAFVITALVLLFNFFTYYLLYIKNRENQNLVEIVNIADRQNMLSQQITLESLMLLNGNLKASESFGTRLSLESSIAQFNKQNRFLLKEINLPGVPAPPNNAAITELLNSVQPYHKSIAAIGAEVAGADSVLLAMNNQLYSRELRSNEKSYRPIMEDSRLMNEMMQQSETINTGKFVSLIVALICLGLLVIEPLFRSNKNNLAQLQLAKVELLQEKNTYPPS